MKKRFTFLLVSAIIFTYFNTYSHADKELDLSAETAILIDSKTGKVLYDKSSSKVMFPASTTKILTAIIAIENSDLTEKVTIDKEAVVTADGTKLGIIEGEVFSMEDLIHALLLSSTNDCAVAIAKHISGSVEEFSKLMNKEAKKMGAKNSNFINPNGLPDEKHVSSAYDLAMIGKYAMKNDVFRNIVKKSTYTIKPTNKTDKNRDLVSSNKMLYSEEKINVNEKDTPIKYDGVLGIKTGYTKAAGQCYVSSVNKVGKEYISVILNSIGTNIYIDTHKLFNYSPSDSKPVLIAKKHEFIDNISIKGGNTSFITALLAKDLKVVTTSQNISDIERELVTKNNLKAPIAKGQVVGKVNFKDGKKLLGSIDVVSSNKVIKDNSKSSNMIFRALNKWWFWALISIVVLRIAISMRRVMYRARILREKSKKKSRKIRKKGQTAK